jgi:hypothetical protein
MLSLTSLTSTLSHTFSHVLAHGAHSSAKSAPTAQWRGYQGAVKLAAYTVELWEVGDERDTGPMADHSVESACRAALGLAGDTFHRRTYYGVYCQHPENLTGAQWSQYVLDVARYLAREDHSDFCPLQYSQVISEVDSRFGYDDLHTLAECGALGPMLSEV